MNVFGLIEQDVTSLPQSRVLQLNKLTLALGRNVENGVLVSSRQKGCYLLNLSLFQ